MTLGPAKHENVAQLGRNSNIFRIARDELERAHGAIRGIIKEERSCVHEKAYFLIVERMEGKNG